MKSWGYGLLLRCRFAGRGLDMLHLRKGDMALRSCRYCYMSWMEFRGYTHVACIANLSELPHYKQTIQLLAVSTLSPLSLMPSLPSTLIESASNSNYHLSGLFEQSFAESFFGIVKRRKLVTFFFNIPKDLGHWDQHLYPDLAVYPCPDETTRCQ